MTLSDDHIEDALRTAGAADPVDDALRAEVATEHGVPANVLRGSTRAELDAHAKQLKPILAESDLTVDEIVAKATGK